MIAVSGEGSCSSGTPGDPRDFRCPSRDGNQGKETRKSRGGQQIPQLARILRYSGFDLVPTLDARRPARQAAFFLHYEEEDSSAKAIAHD